MKKRKNHLLKLKKKSNLFVVIVFVLLLIGTIGILNSKIERESFDVKPLFLKFNLGFGGDSSGTVFIKNNEDFKQIFNLYFVDLENVASLEEKEFSLNAGEKKEVVISFSDILYKSEVYVGQLVVESFESVRKVPIVISIDDENKYFAITQSAIPNYENVYPGGKLGIEVKLTNLKDYKLHDVNVNYVVKSFDDEIITSSETSLVVDEKSVDFSKLIDIPESLYYGNYVLITTIDYKETKSTSSYLFQVEKKKINLPFRNFSPFYVIILAAILGVFWSFHYFISSKNKLELQLTRMHRDELRRNLKVMTQYRKELQGIKNISLRKKELEQWRKGKDKVIDEIKGRQKKQMREFLGLKKKKKGSEMARKLDSWKKQGYHMFELKKEIKKIPKHHINKEVEMWRKQGYSVSVLNKKQNDKR